MYIIFFFGKKIDDGARVANQHPSTHRLSGTTSRRLNGSFQMIGRTRARVCQLLSTLNKLFFFLSPFLILLPTVMCIIKRFFFFLSLFSHMCVYVCVNIYRRRKIWRVPSQRQNAACCCCLHKNRFLFSFSLGCVCRVFFIRSRRFLLHIYSIISLISYRLFREKQWEIGVASNFLSEIPFVTLLLIRFEPISDKESIYRKLDGYIFLF